MKYIGFLVASLLGSVHVNVQFALCHHNCEIYSSDISISTQVAKLYKRISNKNWIEVPVVRIANATCSKLFSSHSRKSIHSEIHNNINSDIFLLTCTSENYGVLSRVNVNVSESGETETTELAYLVDTGRFYDGMHFVALADVNIYTDSDTINKTDFTVGSFQASNAFVTIDSTSGTTNGVGVTKTQLDCMDVSYFSNDEIRYLCRNKNGNFEAINPIDYTSDNVSGNENPSMYANISVLTASQFQADDAVNIVTLGYDMTETLLQILSFKYKTSAPYYSNFELLELPVKEIPTSFAVHAAGSSDVAHFCYNKYYFSVSKIFSSSLETYQVENFQILPTKTANDKCMQIVSFANCANIHIRMSSNTVLTHNPNSGEFEEDIQFESYTPIGLTAI